MIYTKPKNTSIVFLLIIILICLVGGLFELGLGLLAIIPFIFILRWAWQDGSIEVRLLSISFMLGNIFCWVIGFLGCVYLLSPMGYEIGKHTVTTMILINLLTWGSLIGSTLALPLTKIRRKEPFSPSLPEEFTGQALKVTSVIFVIFLVANYISGGLNVRSDVGNILTPGSALYYLNAISSLQYLFFFFLGAGISNPLFSSKNILYLSGLIFSTILISLTGGREGAIRMLFYFVGGSLYSKADRKNLNLLILFSLPFVLVILQVIGTARDISTFYGSDINTRATIVFQVITGQAQPEENKTEGGLYLLFSRMTEPTGQLVIDAVAENEEYIGLKNFERIQYIFIPKIINPEKETPDDGGERLKEYGVNITEFTNAPLTFMADSFERGGYLVTFIASLSVSFCLSNIGKLINKINNASIKSIILVSLSFLSLRFYTPTILGVISLATYNFIRDSLLIVGIMIFIKLSLHKKN